MDTLTHILAYLLIKP